MSWGKLGWPMRLWTQDNLPRNDYLERCFREGRWALASNYARLLVLRNFGGVYLDADMELLQSFAYMSNDKCFVGWESKHQVNNAVIGAIPGHPFIQKMLVATEGEPSTDAATAGPVLLTKTLGVLKRTADVMYAQDAAIYTERYFYPLGNVAHNLEALPGEITERSVTRHHWLKMW